MVGICGVVGRSGSGIEPLTEALPTAHDERQVIHRGDRVTVHISAHAQFHEDQPATADDGSLVWIHGDAYGFEGVDGYEPRTDFSRTDAEYCADLLREHGMDFVAGLNGEFSGLVFDRHDGEVRLFTDRLGSRPLFYKGTDDCLLFSSRLQSIGLHPDVTPIFDRQYLAEFFSVQKAFGTATPLADAWKIPPASVLAVGLNGSVDRCRTYWQPTYRPVDRSPAALAEEITETFRRVFDERVRDDLEYGVMLSGGSDSRLVLGTMTERGHYPTSFHMTNWMSREARTAERVALTAGVDFRLLRRGADYHERLLNTVPQFSNFIGAFDESFASGFGDELSSVDVVLTGYLGDTIFGVYPLYLSRLSRLSPLFENRIESIPEYVEQYLGRYPQSVKVPAFLDTPGIVDVLTEHIRSRHDSIRHHSVGYPSLRELQLCEYYPLTNQFASANTDSLRQITGHWSPFFDNRLIDLHLSVPVRDRIRYNPINHALSRLAPSLAAIPHPDTGIPPTDAIRFGPSSMLHEAWMALKRRCTEETPPAPYLNHSPWINESRLIRNHDFLGAAIERNRDLIEALPFLNLEEVEACYEEHLNGANHWRSLYTLVSLLETPVAERIGSRYQ